MVTIDPLKSIVPIMKLGCDKKLNQILGTAFIVGSPPVVVTAKHVFVDNPLDENEEYCMVLVGSNDQIGLWKIGNILYAEKYDIAVLAAGGVTGMISLKMARTEWPNDRNVLTYEYSSTRINELSNGRRFVEFTPYTHKGNIMCYYDSDFPEVTSTRVFEVSFPILQGASGAPVVRDTDHAVIGMLVACRERELTPAQVVTIEEGDKHKEVYNYFLPTGKGIASSVIIDFLLSEKCNFGIVD